MRGTLAISIRGGPARVRDVLTFEDQPLWTTVCRVPELCLDTTRGRELLTMTHCGLTQGTAPVHWKEKEPRTWAIC